MVVETVAYVNGVAVLHTRSPTNEHRTRTYTVPTRTNAHQQSTHSYLPARICGA